MSSVRGSTFSLFDARLALDAGAALFSAGGGRSPVGVVVVATSQVSFLNAYSYHSYQFRAA